MRHMRSLLFLAIAAVLLAGCAQQLLQKPTAISTQDLAAKVASGEYVQKVDNFLVIFDASSSMEEEYAGSNKFFHAKNLATGFNKTLPEIKAQSGLRVFGPNVIPWQGYNTLTYGMTSYSTAGFSGGLDKIASPSGTTPLATALTKSGNDLKDTAGASAIVIFSDGETDSAATIAAANALKEQFGDRLCIYPVIVGNSLTGYNLLEKVAQTTGCGSVSRGDQLMNGDAMAAFVTDVFFAKAKVAKPEPPKAEPPPIPEKLTIELKVEFDFDKSNVKPMYHAELEKFANFMKTYPNTNTVIEAHTDSIGTKDYNMKLSQRRADSVIKYLSSKFGIEPKRLTAKGYGFSKPIADNKTAEGRQRNRRVEAVITTEKK